VIEPQAFSERISTEKRPRIELGEPHSLEEVEREHILRVLARSASLEEAARTLGIDASTLWRKRRKYESS
jgi:NtrC-family two-component system response regulator AlgB